MLSPSCLYRFPCSGLCSCTSISDNNTSVLQQTNCTGHFDALESGAFIAHNHNDACSSSPWTATSCLPSSISTTKSPCCANPFCSPYLNSELLQARKHAADALSVSRSLLHDGAASIGPLTRSASDTWSASLVYGSDAYGWECNSREKWGGESHRHDEDPEHAKQFPDGNEVFHQKLKCPSTTPVYQVQSESHHSWKRGLSVVCRDAQTPVLCGEEVDWDRPDESFIPICEDLMGDIRGSPMSASYLSPEAGHQNYYHPPDENSGDKTLRSQASPSYYMSETFSSKRCCLFAESRNRDLPFGVSPFPNVSDHNNPMLLPTPANAVWESNPYYPCSGAHSTAEAPPYLGSQEHSPVIMTSNNTKYCHGPFQCLGNSMHASVATPRSIVAGVPCLLDQRDYSPTSVGSGSPSSFRSKRRRCEGHNWDVACPYGEGSIRVEANTNTKSCRSNLPGVYFDRQKKGFRVRFSNIYVGWVSLSCYATYEEAYRAAKQIYDDAAREVAESRDKSTAMKAGIALTIQSRLKPKNPGGRPRTVSKLPPSIVAKIAEVVENAKRIIQV